MFEWFILIFNIVTNLTYFPTPGLPNFAEADDEFEYKQFRMTTWPGPVSLQVAALTVLPHVPLAAPLVFPKERFWSRRGSKLNTRVGSCNLFNSSISKKSNSFSAQVGLYQECGSLCQMVGPRKIFWCMFHFQKVGLPCNGSCPVGSFLCGEVCGENDDMCVTNEFLSLRPRFALMIQSKTSTETVKGFARSVPKS